MASSSAQAWSWAVACDRARFDGARPVAGVAAVSRFCEPGDRHRIVGPRHSTGRLRPQHLAPLVLYGPTEFRPDPERPDKSRSLFASGASLACVDRALRGRQILS